MSADWGAINRLLDAQDGVTSRRQVLARGLRPHDIERLIRRRLWVRALPGVYLNHTGVPTWRQQGWIGVLHYWPSALAGDAAVRSVVGPGWNRHRSRDDIEILIPVGRTVEQVSGFRVTRSRAFEDRVQWNSSPPRIRLEEAVVDLAAAAVTDHTAIGVMADACQSQRTTATRLSDCLSLRPRVARRHWLGSVLRDIRDGTCSVLEHAYLTRVERAHGLPRGKRQVQERPAGRQMFRDVLYPGQGFIVELDGRLFHDNVDQRDVDLERDLDVGVGRRETARLGWGQVTDRACQTAGKIALILQSRGCAGSPHRCGPGCTLRLGRIPGAQRVGSN
ncbi:MAG: hypothetical protein L0H93_07005, partial [Nocardioides sp.]|nr:hypothetical protein [Nocardioides sp.]